MGAILKIWTAVTPRISIVIDGEESGSQDVPLRSWRRLLPQCFCAWLNLFGGRFSMS